MTIAEDQKRFYDAYEPLKGFTGDGKDLDENDVLSALSDLSEDAGKWTAARTGVRVQHAEVVREGHSLDSSKLRITMADATRQDVSFPSCVKDASRDIPDGGMTKQGPELLVLWKMNTTWSEIPGVESSPAHIVEAFIHEERYAANTARLAEKEWVATGQAESNRLARLNTAVAKKTIRGVRLEDGVLILEVEGGPSLQLPPETLKTFDGT